jgi:hypothetical protein
LCHWYDIREPFAYFSVLAVETVWWKQLVLPDEEEAVAKEAVIIEHCHNCGVYDYGHIYLFVFSYGMCIWLS